MTKSMTLLSFPFGIALALLALAIVLAMPNEFAGKNHGSQIGWESGASLGNYPQEDCGKNWFYNLFDFHGDSTLICISDKDVQSIAQELKANGSADPLDDALKYIRAIFGR